MNLGLTISGEPFFFSLFHFYGEVQIKFLKSRMSGPKSDPYPSKPLKMIDMANLMMDEPLQGSLS